MNTNSPHNNVRKHNLTSCLIYSAENLEPPNENHLRIFKAKRTDAYTATYKDIALHSLYDPVREASHVSNFVETQSFDCIILFGAGLGYVISELTKQYKDIPILCVEYDALLFTSILNTWQYPPLCTETPYTFFVQSTPKTITEYLREKGLRNPCIVQTQIAKQFFTNKDKEALMVEVENYKKRTQVNDNTLGLFSRLWQKNIIQNATQHTSRIASLSQLENAYRNIPALLCCAGPSLYQHLQHIQKLKPHMLLVAVDTAVGVLKEHNIIPDFICSVDPQYINTKHLQWHTQDTPYYLIDLAVSPRIFQLSTKQSIFFANKSIIPLAQALYHNMGFEAETYSGGSVATFAWDALRYMGITDIYTVGLDLSYPFHATHSRGCAFENASHMTSTRTSPAETTLHRMLCAAPLVATKSYKNTAVLSDKRLMVYHQWFQTMHEKFPHMKTYTFCEEAARIPAGKHREADTIVQSMRNAIHPRIKDEIHETLIKKLKKQKSSTHTRSVKENAQLLHKKLTDFSTLCRNAMHITHKALHYSISQTELTELQNIEQNIHSNEHRTYLASSPSASEIVGFFVQKDIQNILTHNNEYANTTDEKAYNLYKAMYHCALSLETLLQI